MAWIKIEEEKKKETYVPLFGNTFDLAHAFIRGWTTQSKKDIKELDDAFNFIYKDIIRRQNKSALKLFEKIRYPGTVFKYQTVLFNHCIQLRYLTNEVDNLIGYNTLLKAGIKSKIKNMKEFNDLINENKEITIMLMGLLDVIYTPDTTLVYSNEIEILEQLGKRTTDKYYTEFNTDISHFVFR